MVLVAMVVVTVVSFAVHRAMRLESFLAPGSPSRDPQTAASHALVIPDGRNLEEYVQAGLVDLRIMLVQAARRRPR